MWSDGRLTSQRGAQRRYELHRQRLAHMRPSVDNKPPPTYQHLRANMKRVQIEEERCSTIERNNRRLLEKMTDIMTKTGPVEATTTSEVRVGGSLNREYRKKQLERITTENRDILRRLQACAPQYSHSDWDRGFVENERMVSRICRYPVAPGAARGLGRRRGSDGDMQDIQDADFDSMAMLEEAQRIREMLARRYPAADGGAGSGAAAADGSPGGGASPSKDDEMFLSVAERKKRDKERKKKASDDEEAEKQRIAAEEAEKQRIAAEEAEKERIAAEEAEKKRRDDAEAEQQRIAAAERLRKEEEDRKKAAEEAAAKKAAEEARKKKEEELTLLQQAKKAAEDVKGAAADVKKDLKRADSKKGMLGR